MGCAGIPCWVNIAERLGQTGVESVDRERRNMHQGPMSYDSHLELPSIGGAAASRNTGGYSESEENWLSPARKAAISLLTTSVPASWAGDDRRSCVRLAAGTLVEVCDLELPAGAASWAVSLGWTLALSITHGVVVSVLREVETSAVKPMPASKVFSGVL